ncbi:Metallo-beta-lactamase domain-containing protein [Schistosoma japonicum]|uniref:Metallo-beta-lactamase domain-containing protein 1 n=2 Tax=Schistosoma japonicum TaxID=6182 RepID=A0A4Z2D777_SCHJA|nr:Metallo-beta-lactamase domain-containing protein 1 [Schistosoma japonicum]TNN12323.1 Metallo-beta-lactamase domain-containing protein [Schistosoma japonicum]TNN12324.1 Metallo-beta-lactamase domain-containing protein [Schistosoma japonicum]
MLYSIDIIRNGWTKRISSHYFSSACTISLLKGPKIILIDPGSPWDSNWLLSQLASRGINSEDIDFIVCTHEHIDHIGSLNIFPNSVRIVGSNFEVPGHKDCFSILKTPYEIDSCVHIISTPGHTSSDVSVIVEDIDEIGRVAIVGDLFECEEDIIDPSLWQSSSNNVSTQQKSRRFIFDNVDYIVPGHGAAFKVTKG